MGIFEMLKPKKRPINKIDSEYIESVKKQLVIQRQRESIKTGSVQYNPYSNTDYINSTLFNSSRK